MSKVESLAGTTRIFQFGLFLGRSSSDRSNPFTRMFLHKISNHIISSAVEGTDPKSNWQSSPACSWRSAPGGPKFPVTINSLLVRGSTLKNTDFVHGIVVMSGEDTKIRKNATAKIVTKPAFIERITNKLIRILFLVIIALASVSTFLSRKRIYGADHLYIGDRHFWYCITHSFLFHCTF